MVDSASSPLSVVASISAARRALYGYGMALDAMGLPKDQREVIRHMEQVVNAVMRAYQTMVLLEAVADVGMGPMGIMYGILAGGMGAASIVYSGRALGG